MVNLGKFKLARSPNKANRPIKIRLHFWKNLGKSKKDFCFFLVFLGLALDLLFFFPFANRSPPQIILTLLSISKITKKDPNQPVKSLLILYCISTTFTSTDTDNIINGNDEDFPVTNISSRHGVPNGINNLVNS